MNFAQMQQSRARRDAFHRVYQNIAEPFQKAFTLIRVLQGGFVDESPPWNHCYDCFSSINAAPTLSPWLNG